MNVHGDNLHALKALLPAYAGKVDCIFIDPPYNTGNEGWSYNGVYSPMIRDWLSSNPITIEDGQDDDRNNDKIVTLKSSSRSTFTELSFFPHGHSRVSQQVDGHGPQ
jgi:16S rRNA G966 N2-methylase RsmD